MKPDSIITTQKPFRISRDRTFALLAWTILAVITVIWECNENKKFKNSIALAMGRMCLEKDIAFRRWAAQHGGVYVPVTNATPPNPLLNVPEREITTPSGRHLTIMNPAYMIRQVFEISQLYPDAPQGHITSIKPIRPQNAPDSWETRALKAFETGVTERGEFQVLGGTPVYRYMRPLITEKPCLKCHAAHGYREGQVRGGISVTIPTAGLDRSAFRSSMSHLSIIAVIWLMGIGLIRYGFRRIGVVTAALTVERDNLSSVFDATPMPMLLFNDRLEVVRFNTAFKEYNKDFQILPDKSCGTFLKCANASRLLDGVGTMTACDLCRFMHSLREVSKSGLPDRGEAALQRVNSAGETTEAWLLYGVEAVSLDGCNHLLMSFMDITERKRMEETLYRRKQEFQTLVENSPDPIARYDRECRRLYLNPAMERLAEASAEFLIGKTPADGSMATQEIGRKVQDAVMQALEHGIGVESEASWKDSGGKTCHFQARCIPEFDEDGVVASVLFIARDVTSLRKMEYQLRHAQKMESIGTLAGGVAHDFNNLLTVIGGYAELLKLSLQEDKQKQGFALEISESVKRGAELTRSLLTFSGKHEPNKQYDNLNLIVANLQRSISRLLRSDITLTFGLSNDRLPVFVDRVQIEQVLINLMVNARDALTSGGTIHVSTEVAELRREQLIGCATLEPGQYALVTVTDNGAGMDKKTVERIFEPFFTTKGPGKGTGLGLSIAFGIIGNHNGNISVKSEPGKGSVFGVYLPIFKGSNPPEKSPEQENRALHGNETLLLVDDEPNLLKMTREILMRYGYTVLTAADGVEALELFEAHRDKIKVAIIDLIMPRMNGRDAVERIRQQDPGLPVILMSGYTEEIIDHVAIDALDVVFLQKPVQHLNLLATIRATLE